MLIKPCIKLYYGHVDGRNIPCKHTFKGYMVGFTEGDLS